MSKEIPFRLWMSEDDFEFITAEGYDFTHMYAAKPDRYENYTESAGIQDPPSRNWKWAYSFPITEGYAAVILAKSYLMGKGHTFELFFDLAEPEMWVLATDYQTPVREPRSG